MPEGVPNTLQFGAQDFLNHKDAFHAELVDGINDDTIRIKELTLSADTASGARFDWH